jgi:hypothetical protein
MSDDISIIRSNIGQYNKCDNSNSTISNIMNSIMDKITKEKYDDISALHRCQPKEQPAGRVRVATVGTPEEA